MQGQVIFPGFILLKQAIVLKTQYKLAQLSLLWYDKLLASTKSRNRGCGQ